MKPTMTVLTRDEVLALRARYQRPPACAVSLLAPEPPFGAQKLVEVNTDQMLVPGAEPASYARRVATFYDRDEAVRYANVGADIQLLCELALDMLR